MSEQKGEYYTGTDEIQEAMDMLGKGYKKSLDYYQQFFKKDGYENIFIRSDFILELRDIENQRLTELFYLIFNNSNDREYIRRLDSFLRGNILESLRRREFDRIKNQLWQGLKLRDGNTCKLCGSTFDLTIDHIIPLARGGDNDSSNLQILCRSCNSRKGAR